MADFEVTEATRVRSGSIRMCGAARFAPSSTVREIAELPRVDVISACVGADDSAARVGVAAGARGLVISGYAYNGRPSVDQHAGIEQIAASGIPVVLANRGGQGRIPVDWNDPYTEGRTRPASFSWSA